MRTCGLRTCALGVPAGPGAGVRMRGRQWREPAGGRSGCGTPVSGRAGRNGAERSGAGGGWLGSDRGGGGRFPALGAGGERGEGAVLLLLRSGCGSVRGRPGVRGRGLSGVGEGAVRWVCVPYSGGPAVSVWGESAGAAWGKQNGVSLFSSVSFSDKCRKTCQVRVF